MAGSGTFDLFMTARKLVRTNHRSLRAGVSCVRKAGSVGKETACPIGVPEGRNALDRAVARHAM